MEVHAPEVDAQFWNDSVLSCFRLCIDCRLVRQDIVQRLIGTWFFWYIHHLWGEPAPVTGLIWFDALLYIGDTLDILLLDLPFERGPTWEMDVARVKI